MTESRGAAPKPRMVERATGTATGTRLAARVTHQVRGSPRPVTLLMSEKGWEATRRVAHVTSGGILAGLVRHERWPGMASTLGQAGRTHLFENILLAPPLVTKQPARLPNSPRMCAATMLVARSRSDHCVVALAAQRWLEPNSQGTQAERPGVHHVGGARSERKSLSNCAMRGGHRLMVLTHVSSR